MRTAALCFLVFSAACGDGTGSLVVELRTDLSPGIQFSAVAVRIGPVDSAVAETIPVDVTAVFVGDAVYDGVRIAEIGNLQPGTYRLIVSLLDERQILIVERTILVAVDGPTAVTAVITRDCVGVVCGGPDDTVCHGGMCTDPRCSPEAPQQCTSECESASVCPALAACASSRCESGLCLYAPRDEDCADNERCDVELGCVLRPEQMPDAGSPDTGPPDAGVTVDGGPGCELPRLMCGDSCVDPSSDPLHCDGCDNACPVPPSGGTARCGNNECEVLCDAGLERCGTECLVSCTTAFGAAMTGTYAVPAGCAQLAIRAWGAGGGAGCGGTPRIGAGGFAQSVVATTPSEELTIVVGGAGGMGVSNTGGPGGSPGGGGRGGQPGSGCGGGGGGGFSGVFRGAITQANALVIAGGGGGSGSRPPGSGPAGAGGGVNGEDGAHAGSGATATGPGVGSNNGGRIADPGAALQGGSGGGGGDDGGGGGGGGYWGGGAHHNASSNAGGGGGGSGFATGTLPVLVPGVRQQPGNVDDPDRSGAGAPMTAGRVVVECLD